MLVKLPTLLSAAGKDLRTDLGPMEIGGLVTAISGTRLQTHRLEGRPSYRDGISYWEAVWPLPESGNVNSPDAAPDAGAAQSPGGPGKGQPGESSSNDSRYRLLF